MLDLLTSAVGFGRAAKTPPPSKTKPSNYVAIRAVSRAYAGSTNMALSLWDGLTAEERDRRRVVEERKTLLIFHMKNVGTPLSCAARASPRGGTLGYQPQKLPHVPSLRHFPLNNTNPASSNRPTALSNGRQPRKNSTCSRETTSGSSTRLRVVATQRSLSRP
ncbi:hypothetical protein IMZ48_20050 [Candidatus Bathyarchaeota archaeon]|nr:hypothetical protein [Candidatus Bathyarchaeota archaeon]